MNYELVKQLKDAGFPLNEDYCSHCGQDFADKYTPTLSELIEACGESFEALERINANDWFAASDTDTPYDHGKTPKEAVAKLWLQLHE